MLSTRRPRLLAGTATTRQLAPVSTPTGITTFHCPIVTHRTRHNAPSPGCCLCGRAATYSEVAPGATELDVLGSPAHIAGACTPCRGGGPGAARPRRGYPLWVSKGLEAIIGCIFRRYSPGRARNQGTGRSRPLPDAAECPIKAKYPSAYPASTRRLWRCNPCSAPRAIACDRARTESPGGRPPG